MVAQLKKLTAALKYTPPDFELFEQYGYGLLEIARRAVTNLSLAKGEMHGVNLKNYSKWQSFGGQSKDLVSVYGFWAQADDMIARLNSMDPNERKKHIEFDTRNLPHKDSFERTEDRFVQITAEIAVWEIAHHDIVYTTLNRQLHERLDAWEQYISFAEKDPTRFDPPFLGEMDSNDEYCDERTLLEYARDGITCLRMMGFSEPAGFDRLEPLPYFETYEKRLEELDIRFRKIIHGHHDFVPWADPTYWWHQLEPGQKPPQRRIIRIPT